MILLRRGKLKRNKAVMFNGDVSPEMSGVKKSGLGHPGFERPAAGTRGKRGKARSKKRY